MRGKNILWLTFIAMFLGTMLANLPPALAAETKLRVTPSRVPEVGFGHVGDVYDVAVEIENGVNVWGIGFQIHITPLVQVLVPSGFAKGGFLTEDGTWPVNLATDFDALHGIIHVSITRMPKPFAPDPYKPVYGNGTVFTFKVQVVNAGESPIELTDTTIIDPTFPVPNNLPHMAISSYYYGPTCDLIRVNMPGGRRPYAGEVFTFNSKVRNDGDVPMVVRVRLDIDRAEDGRRVVIRTGQSYSGGGLGEPLPYEYLYLDEFNEWYYEWNNDPTNALGMPDGSYIEGDANAQWASLYGFENIALAGREIADIWLEGYSQYPNGYTEDADIDVYGFSGVSSFAWLGSNYGGTAWDWHGVRWTSDSVLTIMPELADETELNNMEILIYNYYGDAPDVLRVDSMRLKVEFASIVPVTPPEWVIMPGEELELEVITWISAEEHIGSYSATATIEYRDLSASKWVSMGDKQKTFDFKIRP